MLERLGLLYGAFDFMALSHHQTTFEALELAMGSSISALAVYFDTCRRKRNQVDYDLAHAVTETETEELIQKAGEFRGVVESWIRKHHRQYAI